jgi:hypothetical protein
MVNEKLQEITKKFLSDFVEASGEKNAGYALNYTLPDTLALLLPKEYDPNSIYLPMSGIEVNMIKAFLRLRVKGWTAKLKAIVDKLEKGKKLDYDRYRFEKLKNSSEDFEVFKTIGSSKKFDFKMVVEAHGIKSFDIISTTNNFKGTVSLIYRNECPEGIYPVKEVLLKCGNKVIFSWSLVKEDEEYLRTENVDLDNVKDLNSFYLYTNYLQD